MACYAEPMSKVASLALGFNRNVRLVKLGAWTAFALSGPTVFLLMQNYIGVTVTGVIGIFIGLAAFPWSFRGSRLLRRFLVASGLAYGVYGGYVVSRPAAPWQHTAAKTGTSVVVDDRSGAVYALELSEHARLFVREASTGQWTPTAYPGGLASQIALVPEGDVLFAREDRAPRLWEMGSDVAWRARSGFARMSGIAASGGALFVGTSAALMRVDVSGATPVAGVEGATVVCARERRVIAIRSSESPPGRIWRSQDGGATFVANVGASVPATACSVSDDGTVWIISQGTFTGDLTLLAPDGAFVRATVPAPRVEAIVVNPTHPGEAWIGVWGGGVYRTRDRGHVWEGWGLRGFEVSALAIDFVNRRAYAGTGSGVYERALD